MITNIHSGNINTYAQLFAEASEVLTEYYKNNQVDAPESIIISSLGQYFHYFGTLCNINPKFGILPIPVTIYTSANKNTDEGTFNIDVNTRTISTPKSFDPKAGKGVVAVQGDDLAETLWFCIPRYIETTDLYRENIKAVIQWDAPGANGTRIRDVSTPINWSTEIKGSHLVFDWTIDKRITQYPGVVDFVVRFYEKDEDNNLVYSFSTLPASFNIYETLNYDLLNGEYDLTNEELRNQIISRFVNGPAPDGGDANLPLPEPEFLTQPVDAAESEHDLVDLVTRPLRAYAVNGESTSEEGENLVAGLISYTWYKDNNPALVAETGYYEVKPGEKKYEDDSSSAVYETNFNTKKAYFTYEPNSIEGVPGHYTILKGLEGSIADYQATTGKTIYESNTIYTPTGPGEYYCEAKCTAGSTEKITNSNICKIPGPSAPIITQDPKQIYLATKITEGSGYVIEEGYSVEEEATQIVVAADFAEADKAASEKDGLDYHKVAELYYKWYEKNGVDENGVAIWTLMPDETAHILSLANRTNLGYYKVDVTAKRNNGEITVTSDNYVVTELPVKLTFNEPTTDDGYIFTPGFDIEVFLNNESDAHADSVITYQWWEEMGKIEGTEEYAEDRIVEGATSAKFSPVKNGGYYCVVTNTLNGISISTASKLRTVTGGNA